MSHQLDTSSDILKRISRVLLLGLVSGVLASLAAIAFVEIIFWFNDHLLVSRASQKAHSQSPWFTPLIILIPTLGGLLTGLIIWQIKDHRAQSVADVILAVQARLESSALRFKDALLTILATIVSLGSGTSLGQYGPVVHLGAAITRRLTQSTHGVNPAVAIGCGVAAGISTVFNAPIAGIVFAHEVILRHYSLRAFAPITVASSVGFYLSNFVFERPPLIVAPPVKVTYAPEFFAFVIIGVIGALVAVVFMRLILGFGQLAQRLPLWQPFKPALAGLVLGLMATQVPEILGIGKQTMQAALIPVSFSMSDLSILLIAKILATALCLGFGLAGGIFSPALLVGVLLGALIGQGADLLLPNHSSLAMYAISGMAAVTSPIIGAPLTTILIVFELTQSYELATAVMVSVVFSNVVVYRLFGRSLYDVQLKQRGIDLSLGRERLLLDQIKVGDLTENTFTHFSPDKTLQQARTELIKNESTEAFIDNHNGEYLGMLTLNQILLIEERMDISNEKVSSHARQQNLHFNSDMSVRSAMEAMQDFIGESIPVVDQETKELKGVVYESTLVSAYLNLTTDLREEENASA